MPSLLAGDFRSREPQPLYQQGSRREMVHGVFSKEGLISLSVLSCVPAWLSERGRTLGVFRLQTWIQMQLLKRKIYK